MRRFFYKLMVVFLFSAAILPCVVVNRIETVKATHIKSISYTPSLDITGTIESAKSTEIKLSYPVYVRESCVTENSYVNKGQLMFVIDTEKMQEAVKMYDFTEYIDANISADNSVLMQLSDKIYATESGFVRNISALDNSFIMAEEKLCVIDSGQEVMLKITLNQEDYRKVSVGDVVTFSSVTNPDRAYTAVIADKTAHIRKEAGLTGSKTVVDVFANIINADSGVVSGLEICGVSSKEPINMSVLTYDYVGQDENGQYVVVYENGDTEKVYVETGRETDDYLEILTTFDSKSVFIKPDIENTEKLLLEYEN